MLKLPTLSSYDLVVKAFFSSIPIMSMTDAENDYVKIHLFKLTTLSYVVVLTVVSQQTTAK